VLVGTLALQYRDHPSVASVTVYDPPARLSGEPGWDVGEPVASDDVFVIYSESVDEEMRIEGDYAAAEVRGTGHEVTGKENDVADAVWSGCRTAMYTL
jgi:hypothetical protein